MNSNNNLVPYILCALSSAPDQRQSIKKICRIVENRLSEEGRQIKDVKIEIERAIQVANDMGLVSASNNAVRLISNSKPPSGFESSDEQRESLRSMQTESCNEPMDQDNYEDDGHNKTAIIEDIQIKPFKRSGKKLGFSRIFAIFQIKMKRRKSRGLIRRRLGPTKSRRSHHSRNTDNL